MKNTLIPFLLMITLTIGACAPQATAVLAPLETQASIAVSPTVADQPAIPKQYSNNTFGFGFEFPSNWFGPEEYVSDESLRVEIGSDKVYPYGELPEQPSEVKNSYKIVIQYTKNNLNQYWKDTYQSLLSLKDGVVLSDSRNQTIRVRQFNIGRFDGIEYISTLSGTAQTDHVYIRSVILLDQQSNDLLTMMGQPNNVDVRNGADWHTAYKMIDEANLTIFHEIVESIKNNSTGIPVLDKIIDVALRGNTDELKSLIRLAQAKCTFADGLGGPPKCMGGEQEGDVVEVLPVLASEGYFIRKAQMESWKGFDVTALFAVYEVSGRVYSDENYLEGKYAIVLINKEKSTSLTLQIDQGSIVRIDYGSEYPPSIPSENVIRYLIQPGGTTP